MTAFYVLVISFSATSGFLQVAIEKVKELPRHFCYFLKVYRMIGLDFDRRAASENPALRKAEAMPV